MPDGNAVNGDGISDVLFRNGSTGDVGFYEMNAGGSLQGWHDIGGSSTTYTVAGGRLTCPQHAASFDLATGASDQAWAPPLRTYPARIVGGAIEVGLD